MYQIVLLCWKFDAYHFLHFQDNFWKGLLNSFICQKLQQIMNICECMGAWVSLRSITDVQKWQFSMVTKLCRGKYASWLILISFFSYFQKSHHWHWEDKRDIWGLLRHTKLISISTFLLLHFSVDSAIVILNLLGFCCIYYFMSGK